MKRFSWKLCVSILVFGIVVWAGAGLFSIKQKEQVMFKKFERPGIAAAAPKTDWYAEAKFWGETTGKVASGIGGVCLALKTVIELFKKKRKR